MEQEADWIWVSDDDAYLKDDALKQASDYLEEQPDLDKISAICGKSYQKRENGYQSRKILLQKRDPYL